MAARSLPLSGSCNQKALKSLFDIMIIYLKHSLLCTKCEISLFIAWILKLQTNCTWIDRKDYPSIWSVIRNQSAHLPPCNQNSHLFLFPLYPALSKHPEDTPGLYCAGQYSASRHIGINSKIIIGFQKSFRFRMHLLGGHFWKMSKRELLFRDGFPTHREGLFSTGPTHFVC